MATYNSNVWGTLYGSDLVGAAGLVTIVGSVAIPAGKALATGDIINLFRVRSGGLIRNLWVENDDFGDAVPGTLGTWGLDDNLEIDNDCVTTDVDFEDAQVRKWENGSELIDTAAGASARLGAEFAAPMTILTEDAAFKIVLGTVTGASTTGVRRIKFQADVVFWGPDQGEYAYTWNGVAGTGLAST